MLLVLAEVVPGVLVEPDAFANQAELRLRLGPLARRAGRSEVAVEASSRELVQLRFLDAPDTALLLLHQPVRAPALRHDLEARDLPLRHPLVLARVQLLFEFGVEVLVAVHVLLGRVGPRQVDYALVLAELVDLLVHRQVFIDDIRLVEELMPGWQLALHFAQVEIEAVLESIRLAPLVYHLVPQFLLLGLRFLFSCLIGVQIIQIVVELGGVLWLRGP